MENISKLDTKDKKILYYLDLNARMPASTLSTKVGLSKEAVRYRIKRLEKEGIIKGYLTVLDVSRLGYMSFRIYLKLQAMTPSKEKEFFKYLDTNHRVGWFVSVQGSWDVVMVLWVKDIYDFEEFWIELLQRFGVFIERHWISIFSRLIHLNKRFLSPSESETSIQIQGQRNIEKVDKLDLKILKYLSENSRSSLLDLEKKIGESYKVISYRIKRLEKTRVILCYRVFIDLPKIGYKYYKVFFGLQNINFENLKALEEFVTRVPNTVFIDKMIGGADFEVEFQALGTDEIRQILDSIRFEFPDLIRNFDMVEYYQEHKLTYLPSME